MDYKFNTYRENTKINSASRKCSCVSVVFDSFFSGTVSYHHQRTWLKIKLTVKGLKSDGKRWNSREVCRRKILVSMRVWWTFESHHTTRVHLHQIRPTLLLALTTPYQTVIKRKQICFVCRDSASSNDRDLTNDWALVFEIVTRWKLSFSDGNSPGRDEQTMSLQVKN